VSCKYNLYLDVNRGRGSILYNFPQLDPREMENSCVLDAAEHGGLILEEVGKRMNLTRERVRQLEVRALERAQRRVDEDGGLTRYPFKRIETEQPSPKKKNPASTEAE